jgi:hypothetical protein
MQRRTISAAGAGAIRCWPATRTADTWSSWLADSEKVLKKQGGKLKIGELEPSSKL